MSSLAHAVTLQDQRAPDINIIAEKCAFEGFTRFEDRFKMPLGISINYTSYAAKLLAEVRTQRHPRQAGLCSKSTVKQSGDTGINFA